MPLAALVLNCTLKPSPRESNTGALAQVVVDAQRAGGAATEMLARALTERPLPAPG